MQRKTMRKIYTGAFIPRTAAIASVFALFAAVSSLRAGDATWKFREGVGTSPENPALWTDTENWEGGEPASGLTATATFPDGGAAGDVVWVKLPDDAHVELGGFLHTSTTTAKYNFIGGMGFRFGYNQTGGGKSARLQAGKDATSAWDCIYSPVVVGEESYIEVRGFNLACPMTFEGTDGGIQMQMHYPETRYRCDWYAPCGGETRSCIPDLEVLSIAHTDFFIAPNNNDAHTGCWVATEGSKLLKYVSGKKGTALAVGQYVHAEGVIADGAYVEYIYSDGYIGLSSAAVASSSDATAGTQIAFDRCYYKLTQHLAKYHVPSADSLFGFGERKAPENEMTLQIDGWLGAGASSFAQFTFPNQIYYSSQNEPMDSYPQAPVVVLPDMSDFVCPIGGRGANLRFSSTETGGSDIKALKFYESATFRQFGCIGLDTPEGIVSTVVCTNQWYGSLGKKGDGELTVKTHIAGHHWLWVYDGLFTLDPSAANSTLDKAVVKSGGTFRLAADRSLSIETLNVEAGARIVIAQGATLPVPTSLAFAAGGIVRIEAGVVFDATGWDFPDGTIFEGPGRVSGLSKAKIAACIFRDGASVYGGNPGLVLIFR